MPLRHSIYEGADAIQQMPMLLQILPCALGGGGLTSDVFNDEVQNRSVPLFFLSIRHTSRPLFFEIYFLWWIFLILEFVVCAQMRACMPDRLPEVANAILV